MFILFSFFYLFHLKLHSNYVASCFFLASLILSLILFEYFCEIFLIFLICLLFDSNSNSNYASLLFFFFFFLFFSLSILLSAYILLFSQTLFFSFTILFFYTLIFFYFDLFQESRSRSTYAEPSLVSHHWSITTTIATLSLKQRCLF